MRVLLRRMPDFLEGDCQGCMEAHRAGDCYSRDCVIRKGLSFCGECLEFPCPVILTRPHCTVLDKDWLNWKRRQKEGTQNEG